MNNFRTATREYPRVYKPPMDYWLFCEPLLHAPHILVAGATGSGKSVLINDFLYSAVALTEPRKDRWILIDPKRVELYPWAHTWYTERYASEMPEIISALDFCISTMEHRYANMRNRGLTLWDGADMWIIIDELADLMTTNKKEIMPRLQRIAQLGRAAKIHLFCATQCPNRRVIPAELTLNFTHKIALRCDSAIESRQVLNDTGAELLPLHGTAILRAPGSLTRLTIPMTSSEMLAKRRAFYAKKP